jgi:RNA polymerase sigma factor (sigma-70 family)
MLGDCADTRRTGDSPAASMIQSALASLPPIHREIIVLREWEGLSYQDIAYVLDTQVGTVKSRLSRAMKSLRDAIKHMEHGNEV